MLHAKVITCNDWRWSWPQTLSFVNGFRRRRWVRMHSFWTWLFGPMRWHLSWMVQRTSIIVCTGLLKIWTFMSTSQWIYQDFQSGVMGHLGVLWNCSLKEQWLVPYTSTCFKNPLFPPFVSCMEIRTCSINKMGHPHTTTVMSGPILTTLVLTNG